MTQHREEMKKNVTDLIAKLPEALKKFSQIMENENQTPAEQREAVRTLTEEDPKVRRNLDLHLYYFENKQFFKIFKSLNLASAHKR